MFSWGKTTPTVPSLDSLVSQNRCVMFSMPSCPWCVKAESLLKKNKLACEVVDMNESQFLAFEVIKETAQSSVPNIFIDGEHVGGHSALVDRMEKCTKKNTEKECDFFNKRKRR